MISQTSLTITTLFIFLGAARTFNPLMLALILFLATISAIALAVLRTGIVWFPIIVIILFLGGVLVTFIILCSLTPNEKFNTKIKSGLILALVYVLYPISARRTQGIEPSISIKSFIDDAPIFATALFLMSLYFLRFNKVLGRREGPIRTLWCSRLRIL